ncbi:hypothetical protein FV222_11945 [Methylobacterium sp. WL103]|uniref:hypothetical protein n=1 Tax=Methylobacterium sp. WL103 TaxID=2603891 RepID=UPI0011C72A43|nr:hypothetical protein [Methylobacterium sp. WL103]TXN00296.1 hypothetical protein FV222_11945 [Methylobacterium sp. WL103]
MPSTLETPVNSSAYRALILLPDGRVLDTNSLMATNDDEAIRLAEAMVDGHAVELWDGLRYIEYFAAKSPRPDDRPQEPLTIVDV